MFEKIKKRDGRIVKFESERITNVIRKAGLASGEFDDKIARKLTIKVLNLAQSVIVHKAAAVEEIQDIHNIRNLKKLKAQGNHYRIRIGDYRLGLIVENNTISFVRCLHRSDVYLRSSLPL